MRVFLTRALLLVGLFTWSAQTLQAQFFTFGKNRVQYDEFDWRYIQSEHFDVFYYSSGNYKLAEMSTQVLESAYVQIANDFKHEIAERITVIIYDSDVDFMQTNVVALPDVQGILGVTDLFKNRITVWFTGDYNGFKHTLHHELVHGVINDMFYGGSLQSAVQNNIQLQIPLWFNEGMAEFSSVGFSTETDNLIRDAIINNYLPPIRFLGGFFNYRGGESLWNYIVDTYGRQKIGEIFQNLKSTRNVDLAFRQSLGLSIDELSDRWHAYLKKRYFPEVAVRETADEQASQVTSRDGSGGVYNTSPAISPQGDKIAILSNRTGTFNLEVVSAVTGQRLKTLVESDNNIDFEALNILNPNLTWSPDGRKLALSSRSKGADHLTIIDYQTGRDEQYRFPEIDAILTTSWSPDGKKIVFSGTIGPYSDLFVFNLETRTIQNVTNDLFSDLEPYWSADSKSIFFSSDRGGNVALGAARDNYNMLLNPALSQRDLYRLRLGENEVEQLTNTPEWTETRPVSTGDGRIVFVSDQNGIPNIYELDLANRRSRPITDFISGVQQMSITPDGTKIAFNAYNEGYLDIYLLRAPFSKIKEKPLVDNEWAKMRNAQSEYDRVPAMRHAYEMYGSAALRSRVFASSVLNPLAAQELGVALQGTGRTTPTGQTKDEKTDDGEPEIIDFRNYVFGDDLDEEAQEVVDNDVFKPQENLNKDGKYIPRDYRLKFSPDFQVFQGLVSNVGSFGFAQLVYSDVLGNHRLTFGSNLVFDLRNSSYFISYGNFTRRTNFVYTWFHNAFQFQTFVGTPSGLGLQLVRFRQFGFNATAEYPIDKFTRVSGGVDFIGIQRDISSFSTGFVGEGQNESSSFVLPKIAYTVDQTEPGFLTPSGGYRYALQVQASPPVTPSQVSFASIMGDYRKYFGSRGSPYSLAFRLSGGVSVGADSQTFLMGGINNWINQRFEGGTFPLDQLEDLFLTTTALPMRGYLFNTLIGDKFTLANLEFRFPLVAAILPGPIPILPLYNMTGILFVDAGMAWGEDIRFSISDRSGNVIIDPADVDPSIRNSAGLDFSFSKEREFFLDPDTGEIFPPGTTPPPGAIRRTFRTGDILLSAGYGLRTILLGLPFRFDVGFPFDGDRFNSPVYHFSLGFDF